MCCEECPKYVLCDETDHLKDKCCPRCPEYENCADVKETEGGDEAEDRGDGEEEDYHEV
jgi:hypothetical protein